MVWPGPHQRRGTQFGLSGCLRAHGLQAQVVEVCHGGCHHHHPNRRLGQDRPRARAARLRAAGTSRGRGCGGRVLGLVPSFFFFFFFFLILLLLLVVFFSLFSWLVCC